MRSRASALSDARTRFAIAVIVVLAVAVSLACAGGCVSTTLASRRARADPSFAMVFLALHLTLERMAAQRRRSFWRRHDRWHRRRRRRGWSWCRIAWGWGRSTVAASDNTTESQQERRLCTATKHNHAAYHCSPQNLQGIRRHRSRPRTRPALGSLFGMGLTPNGTCLCTCSQMLRSAGANTTSHHRPASTRGRARSVCAHTRS